MKAYLMTWTRGGVKKSYEIHAKDDDNKNEQVNEQIRVNRLTPRNNVQVVELVGKYNA